MVRLDELCIINMGQSPDSSTYNEDGNGLPFFQGNADFGATYPVVRMWCSEPTKRAQIDDILISVRAPIGALNIANCECCIGRGLAALTVNKNSCIQKYLWYALSNKVEELNSKGTGSTFKAINKKILAETEIPLPSLDEQRKIAAVLDKVSDLIAKRRQQLDKLDELVQARFVEMFGDPISNPHKWELQSLSNICKDIYGGGTPSKSHPEYFEGSIPWISPKDMKSDIIMDSIDHITEEAVENSSTKMVPKGAVLMVIRSGILKHTLPVAIAAVELTVNQDMKAFIVGENVTAKFLMYYFRTIEADVLSGVRSVTADNIDFKEFQKRMVILPPIELQNRFDAFVEQTEKTKTTISESLEKLETLKKALMQEYFG